MGSDELEVVAACRADHYQGESACIYRVSGLNEACNLFKYRLKGIEIAALAVGEEIFACC